MLKVVCLCHSKNIIHRDIKPENFLLANEDEAAPVKAIDFGLAVFCTSNQLPITEANPEGALNGSSIHGPMVHPFMRHVVAHAFQYVSHGISWQRCCGLCGRHEHMPLPTHPHACTRPPAHMHDLLLCPGTPWYLAPEACRAKWWPATDIWAVGILAAFLLTGTYPFIDRMSPAMPDLVRTL